MYDYDSLKLIEMVNNTYLSRLKVLNMTRTNQGVIEEIEGFLSFLESIKKEILKEREENEK